MSGSARRSVRLRWQASGATCCRRARYTSESRRSEEKLATRRFRTRPACTLSQRRSTSSTDSCMKLSDRNRKNENEIVKEKRKKGKGQRTHARKRTLMEKNPMATDARCWAYLVICSFSDKRLVSSFW